MGNIRVDKKPLISVIVPVYNVEKYIRQCVDSILMQTYENLEIILVDDESPDNCPQICEEYAKTDSRVRVIHKKNGGLSDARNAALDIAQGEFVGFVDSDDWIESDMFEYLMNGLVNYQADISCCEVINVYKYRMQYKNIKNDIVYSSKETLQQMFSDQMENYACNKLYKKELWDNIRYPVGKNFEDILTIYKIVEKAEKIAVLKEGKYYYRRREDSISGNRDFKNRLHIYTAIIERYEDVVQRMPEFCVPLFHRVWEYYISELSEEIIMKPEKREENLKLLKLMAPFVEKHMNEIADAMNMKKNGRLKMKYFSEGTIEGCKVSLKYHKKIVRCVKIKKIIKKVFKL